MMNLDIFSTRNAYGVPSLSNLYSIHYFIFKLCIMIVHILKMCTSHFVHI